MRSEFYGRAFGRKLVKRVLLGVGAAGVGLAAWGHADRAAAQGVGPHVGMGVLAGDAAGLDDGYVHFGGFVPLTQPSEDSLWFTDGSLLLYNEGTDYLGGNVGVGYRSYSCTTDSILGGYVYYDRRDLDLYEFNQVGVGVESLGRRYDARLNVNVPVGPRQAGVTTGVGFIGGGIGAVGKGYSALTTVDGEVGALLLRREQLQFRAFVGAYGLFDGAIDDTAGARGRLEARLADQCFVGAYLEHDDEFDTTGGFTFEYRFGRGPCRSENSSSCLRARLGDPVQRRKYIAVAEREAVGMLTDGGEEIEVEFVSNSGPLTASSTSPSSVSPATSSGSGTADDPYTHLSDVGSSEADIVYVMGGVYDGQAMTVSHAGQRVWGGSQAYTITSDQGTFTLPASGGSAVVIRNSAGNAISIAANDVSIVGFRIENPGTAGISTSGVTGVTIRGNTIINSATSTGINFGVVGANIIGNTIEGGSEGIRVGSLTGSITDNTFTNNQHGILVVDSITGDIRGNVVSDATGAGMWLQGDLIGDLAGNNVSGSSGMGVLVGGVFLGDGGSIYGNVTSNNVSSNGSYGVRVTGDDGVTGNIDGNTFNGNDLAGLSVMQRVGGNVTNNTASDSPTEDGLQLLGGVAGDLASNTTNNNNDNGIEVLGQVNGDVFGNIANNNASRGISISDDVTGDVSNNSANTNGLDGIYIIADVGGNVANNTASGNVTRDGIYVEYDVAGGVFGNTANDNGDNGIDIDGTITGATSPNTTTGNVGAGFEN